LTRELFKGEKSKGAGKDVKTIRGLFPDSICINCKPSEVHAQILFFESCISEKK
jgi:hypothetical protein